MQRSQLEHLIRAAAAVLGEDAVIVVGSQAILASIDEGSLPPAAVVSIEANIVPMDGDDAKSDLIDGSIGEASMFHEMFGVYAQGVGLRTAKLAAGWRDRLIAVTGPGTRGATGWCLERHDLVAAKLIAGREKDIVFFRALQSAGLVDPKQIEERLKTTPDVDDQVRQRALAIAAIP